MIGVGRKAVAIARANLTRFVRDRSNVFFVFILPLGIVLLIGSQFGGDPTTSLGVYSPSDDSGSADVVEALESDDRVSVVRFGSEEEMIRSVERGAVSAGVSLAGDLDGAVLSEGSTEIGFVSRPDGFGPQLQAIVADALGSATDRLSAARYAISLGVEPGRALETATSVAAGGVPGIDITTTTTGDSIFEGVTGQFDIGASSQVVLFMFLTGLAGSAAVIQSRQLGITRRMVGTPTSISTIIAGEALGRFAVVLTQGLYIMVATILLFQVDWGNPLGAGVVLIAFSAVGAGAAMLFGTLFRNDQQAGSVGVVVGLGLAALGGSMLPFELFSDTMQRIARFTPHAWANEAFAELLRRDGTVADILPQLGVLAGFAFGLFVLATWRMRVVITRV